MSQVPTDKKKHIITLGCQAIEKELRRQGFSVSTASKPSDLEKPEGHLQPNIVLFRSTEIHTKKTEDFVSKLRGNWPITDVIVWAPRPSADLVLGVMKAGAKDVVLSEDPADLISSVEQISKLQKIIPRMKPSNLSKSHNYLFEGLISRSPRMWEVFADIDQVAPIESNILILGETGTGKELVARAIHKRSSRKGRFVAINCAAVPEHLIDSELFGHVKGAFTGASSDKKGLFRYADGGTLLLDEVGNMPLPAQYHLLRVLQESTIRPVGAHQEIETDVRIIAATSVPLEQYIAEGKFREDLFYRLDVFRIGIPPLRDRHDDIAFLFAHFAKKYAKQYGLRFPDLTDHFLDALIEFDWPGNVRQLENITERLVLAHADEKLMRRHLKRALKPFINESQKSIPRVSAHRKPMDVSLTYEEAVTPLVENFERDYLTEVLRLHKGRIQNAADHAGMSRRTLLRKLKQHGIDKNKFKNI